MKASKMVACLSVSAVLLSLFASGASVTVPDTQPSAAAVLQAEEYVEDSLAAYLAAHAFDGTLSGRTISLPVAEEGVTSDLEQPVSWTFECEEAGFYNVYVEYIPLPGTGEAHRTQPAAGRRIPVQGHGAVGIPALLRQHVGRGNPDEGQRGNPSARHRGF